MDIMVSSDEAAEAPGELPVMGLRNYWYPALAAWRLRRRPRAITLLGEDIVLYRDGGRVFALQDRCAHRGAKLSKGTCQFRGSGAISCPYHGWTYDGTTGRCVAKLMEGPDARLPAGAAVKPYAAREHAGIVWVFVGDMDAVPLADDLPACLR
ncbi:MAG: Rieske 2Fe-2S domain-containing protein, partial [Alphaproteobacteria bacterium]|nr:Rieske 2Fe-2S domain-containing protein [Alphaproteobacteria bacterium]